MQCWIYKGTRKANTYLYVVEKDKFDLIPDALINLLGDLSLVVGVDLSQKQKLAQADINQVKEQLTQLGYFLQMPPGDQKVEKAC